MLARSALTAVGAAALAVLAVPASALAGDPCPIDFVFFDSVTKDGVDRTALLDGLKTQFPLLGISYRNGNGGGVDVTAVAEGSNAKKAGLEPGMTIVSIDGTPVPSQGDADRVFDAASVGTKFVFEVTRDDTVKKIEVVYGRQDPVVGSLMRYADDQSCASIVIGDFTSEQMSILDHAFFDEDDGSLRCKDAHDDLMFAAGTETFFDGGEIVVMRTADKVAVASAGWATACVDVADFDGEALTKEKVAALWDEVTEAYVADRHENP